MDKLKHLHGLIFCFMLSACGSDDNQSSTSSSSSSSLSSSSSSLSSSSLAQVSNSKILEVKFADNGCLESSNADAFTDFDFAGSSRRMLSWSCVTDSDLSALINLNLFYGFDANLGCYKKVHDDEALIKGGLYSKIYSPDCSVPAESILQPSYSLEIVELNITPSSRSDDPKFGFLLSYGLKNNGTLPITQYRIKWQESKYPSDSFSSVGSYDSSSQLLPGKSTISVPISMYSSEYKPVIL